MHICVCVKQTPDIDSVYIDPVTEQVDVERFVEVLKRFRAVFLGEVERSQVTIIAGEIGGIIELLVDGQ